MFINTGNPTVRNCIFRDNDGHVGAGMSIVNNSGPVITNCLFIDNVAVYECGGMFIGASSPHAVNCTFSRNISGQTGGGGIMAYNGAAAVVTNCILWENKYGGNTDESAQIHVSGDSSAAISYTCIQGLTGGLGGTGNIGDDPDFADPDGADDTPGNEDDDFRLQVTSPCINAGDDTAVSEEADLDGNPRKIGTVDMGAYEFQGETEMINIFTGNANGDALVNIADAIVVLSYQFSGGPRPKCFKAADANHDYKVEIADAITILAYQFSGGKLTAPDGTKLDSSSIGCWPYTKEQVEGTVIIIHPPACEEPCVPSE